MNDTQEQVEEYWAERAEADAIADAWDVRLQDIDYMEAMSCE